MKFSKEILLKLLYFGQFVLKALVILFEAIWPFPCFHSKIILICSKDFFLFISYPIIDVVLVHPYLSCRMDTQGMKR